MARMTRKTITKWESKACKRPAGCGTLLKEGRHCLNADEVKREQNLRSWSGTEERCEQEIPSLHARSPLHLNMCLCSPTRPWLLTNTNEHVLLTGSRALQQDTRALSVSSTMHPGLKTPSPHTEQPHQASLYLVTAELVRLNLALFKNPPTAFPLGDLRVCHLLGAAPGETPQPHRATGTAVPAQRRGTRARTGTLLLAVASRLLPAATGFPGGPERIGGDETSKTTVKRKCSYHTHTHEAGRSRGCFRHSLISLVVRLKRFHIQPFSFPFPVKTFWFNHDIPLTRVEREGSAAIPASLLERQAGKKSSAQHTFTHIPRLPSQGTGVGASSLCHHVRHEASCRVQPQLLW